jgi:UDP-N-acetylglucosamine transferase subunit ALG13
MATSGAVGGAVLSGKRAVIFVTVGTQLPFDRLVKAVDEWAGGSGTAPAFAQIGDAAYRPTHMEWDAYLPAARYRQRLEAASLIVSHAGIGSLLVALQARKPMLVMPRRAALNEIRNDHQLATAKWLRQLPGITVVDDTDELNKALRCGMWQAPDAVRAEASPELLSTVRAFIEKS